MAEPRFAKSKVRPGKITCDPSSQTLLVHYEIEATVIGDYGEKLSTDTKWSVTLSKMTRTVERKQAFSYPTLECEYKRYHVEATLAADDKIQVASISPMRLSACSAHLDVHPGSADP